MAAAGKPEVYNFEISDKNFDELVLLNSHKLPVFVLFMSPVSMPSLAMENALIDYANEFAGQFILARLDVDMYKEVQERLQVTNVPMLKVFKDGNMVHQEMGTITEEELAALFRKFDISNPDEDLRLEAMQKRNNGEFPEAIQLLTQAIQMNPSNSKVAMDMCQVFLDLDMLAEAAELYTKFPNKLKETDKGRFLIGQITFKKLALDTDGLSAIKSKLAANPNDEEAMFDLAVCQIATQDYDSGMAQLLSLLEFNHNAKGGGAQELAVALINMVELDDKDKANRFRQQMSTALAI
jgi:putative thioredoxin